MAFLLSIIITQLIISHGYKFSHFILDKDLISPQKIHKIAVPRIGGVAIFISFFIVTIIFEELNSENIKNNAIFQAIIAGYLIFLIGLFEDITGNLSVKLRLILISTILLAMSYLLNIQIERTGVEFLDHILDNKLFSILFTVFAITGLINSYNIIDGVNGLASFTSITSLLSLLIASSQFNDPNIFFLTLISISSTLGFFFYNFPRGLIFIGDCGAYLLGFLVAIFSIFLINNVEEISPFFIILINIYPITETLFSIYRRIKNGRSPGSPDLNHLHSLIYRRLAIGNTKNKSVKLNSASSIFIWPYLALSNILAIIYCTNSYYLIFFITIFFIIYLISYKILIRLQ
jgi:UDP-GlcNAc:undecaprenyl-phosphate GlcNAc-1-phosphate transferase